MSRNAKRREGRLARRSIEAKEQTRLRCRSVPDELTSPLDHWYVQLVGGEIVDVAAHAVKERDDFLVFVALVTGTPNRELAIAAFPATAVAAWGGGKPADGTFPRIGPLPLI